MQDGAGKRQANGWARFGRAAMRIAHQQSRIARTLALSLIAILWVVFAIWGRLAAEPQTTLPMMVADGLYATLAFMAPKADFVWSHDMPWQWQVGRFLAVLLPLLGIYWTLKRWLLSALATVAIQAGAEGHVVLIGRKGSADQLARATSKAGDPVVLVDDGHADRADHIASLAKTGILVLTSHLEDRHTLARARAKAAKTVCAWSNRDSDSLVDIFSAGEQMAAHHSELVVRIMAPLTLRALRNAPDLLTRQTGRLRPVSQQGAALRKALQREHLVRDAVDAGRDRVTVRLWGDSTAIRWAAELLLKQNWSIHLAGPQLVIDPAGEAGHWDQWLRGQAALFKHAPQVFEPEAMPSIVRDELDTVHDHGAVRHIVDLGDDEDTLAKGFALAAELRQRFETPPPVQMVLRDSHKATALVREADLNFADPILLRLPTPIGDLLSRPEDELAANLHLEYQRTFGDDAALPAVDWRDLPESFVEANRAAADHVHVKRFDEGSARAAGMGEADLVAALSRTEHHRWCIERLLDGWIPGARDNVRRFHPDLKPWDELDRRGKLKDVAQVRNSVGDLDEEAIAAASL